MSPTYLAGIVVVLSQVLPLIGINVGSEALTTMLATAFTIGAGLVVMYRRLMKGDVSIFGAHK
jgi:hypothetical protein